MLVLVDRGVDQFFVFFWGGGELGPFTRKLLSAIIINFIYKGNSDNNLAISMSHAKCIIQIQQ